VGQPARMGRGVAGDLQRMSLRLQRGVQRRLQAALRAHVGSNPPALERYYRDYLRDLRRLHRMSSYGELHQALLDADLVLIGDYHTLRQSQEIARRLLERAALDERPVLFGVEMVLAEHQVQLDAYMRGELTDEEFLTAIRYRQNWNFRWRNYRPLLETARRVGARVLAVNTTGSSARARDARMAARLVAIQREHPGARLLVLVGDMHLAANHLPAALDREQTRAGLPPDRRLIVYQNSDDLYWNLAARGAEASTQVVRMGSNRFCVLEVPPWVKLQSYLGWEKELEALEESLEGPETTATSVVEHLVRQLGDFLGLPPADVAVEVFSNLDEGFFDAVGHAELDDQRVREIHLQVFSNRGCYVPEIGVVYLPYLSAHHAAEEAMHVVQYAAGGFTPVVGDVVEDFYARILWGAYGHAASKIVNTRRQAPGEALFRGFLRAAARQLHEPELVFRKLVARFVVQHLDHEHRRVHGSRGRLQQIYAQELDVTLEIVQALSGILGEKLFAALRDGRLTRESFRDLVCAPRPASPSQTYFDLVRRLTT